MSYVMIQCKKCQKETPHWQNFVTRAREPNQQPMPTISYHCVECSTINNLKRTPKCV